MERVAELADDDRAVRPAEVAAPEQIEGTALGERRVELLFRQRGDGIGQVDGD
ncbi:MAG TPA: hypothetical protein VIR59_00030 [Gaiellaceae bacterium]